jgi:hypothetical protein
MNLCAESSANTAIDLIQDSRKYTVNRDFPAATSATSQIMRCDLRCLGVHPGSTMIFRAGAPVWVPWT